jgi:hypothetical protein
MKTPTTPERSAIVAYDNALAFVAKLDYLSKDELIWLRDSLIAAALELQTETALARMFRSMAKAVSARLE